MANGEVVDEKEKRSTGPAFGVEQHGSRGGMLDRQKTDEIGEGGVGRNVEVFFGDADGAANLGEIIHGPAHVSGRLLRQFPVRRAPAAAY